MIMQDGHGIRYYKIWGKDSERGLRETWHIVSFNEYFYHYAKSKGIFQIFKWIKII